jgi:hypothetical protein
MVAKVSEDIPRKILRMLPGKGLRANEDLVVATAHKVENIEGLDEAKNFLHMLATASCHTAFVQGGVLNRIREECWHEQEGRTFDQFLRENGVRPSTAYARIRLYDNLVESGCSRADWELIGWVKLRLIAPFLTAEDRAQWIDLADSKSLPELIHHVRAKQSKSSAQTSLLRETVKKAGYQKALHVIEEIWPDLEIKVYEP